jgi:hypothetical protein
MKAAAILFIIVMLGLDLDVALRGGNSLVTRAVGNPNPKVKHLATRVYIEHCQSSWAVSRQGVAEAGRSDWVELACDDDAP